MTVALVIFMAGALSYRPAYDPPALSLDSATRSGDTTTHSGTAIASLATSASLRTALAFKEARTTISVPKRRTEPLIASQRVSAGQSVSASSGWNSANVSWYGPGFYGNSTANGETYSKGTLTFAHKSMAFGTRIEFKSNGKTVVARCNDRGPYVHGRTFDLGHGTAAALGHFYTGTLQWRYVQ